jgi:hypothetical protein
LNFAYSRKEAEMPMAHKQFLTWAQKLLSGMAPGERLRLEDYYVEVKLADHITLAIDAFQGPPFTMRVHLVTQDEKIKAKWKRYADDGQNGRRPVASGPFPEGRPPVFREGSRGRVRGYLEYEWQTTGTDYAQEILRVERMAKWFRGVVR